MFSVLSAGGAVGLPSGSFPAGARGLDDAAGRIGGLLYSHFGGVEQHGVVGHDHRRVGPARVSRVAAADVLQHVLEGEGLAPAGELAPAALGAGLRRGGDEQLGGGVRRDDGADVAAVEDGAGRGPRGGR